MAAIAPPATDERSALLGFLAQQRYGLELTAYGLTDAQARLTPTAGSLSVGGLIKHCTQTERGWLATVQQLPAPGDQSDYADGFRLNADESLAGVIADYRRAADETAAVLEGIADLGQPVPVPRGVPWFPDDVEAWSVRWVLLHLIQETARHAGHADIVRESIDGATQYPLVAAAEGWPATPWMAPWQPPDAAQS